MSFSATTPQFRNRTKDVTRRLGWDFLKPGMVVMAVEKAQGLKKGEHAVKLGPIRIVNVWPEPLDVIDQDECRREGFPDRTPAQFVRFFCDYNGCTPTTVINRIEFAYIDEDEHNAAITTPPRPQIVASDGPQGDAHALARALAALALAVARQRAAAGVLHFPQTHDTDERAA